MLDVLSATCIRFQAPRPSTQPVPDGTLNAKFLTLSDFFDRRVPYLLTLDQRSQIITQTSPIIVQISGDKIGLIKDGVRPDVLVEPRVIMNRKQWLMYPVAVCDVVAGSV